MKNFYKLLFMSTLIVGTLMSISSSSWLATWIGLEINLLSILPLMLTHSCKFSSEAMIKYFIIQAMGSALFLFSIILMLNYNQMIPKTSCSIIMTLSLLLKLGAAPLHFWLPEVLKGLPWNMVFIMSSWQKIAPMILLAYTTYLPEVLSFSILASSIMGGIQGLNQTCLRKILAYSSINHMSWMLASLFSSMKIWFLYFLIYCILNFNMMYLFSKNKMFHFSQLQKLMSNNKTMKLTLMLNMLSLGGLPPFLGFLPKWMITYHLTMINFRGLAIILILFTLVSLFFYLRLMFSSLTMNLNEPISNTVHKPTFFTFTTNFISLSSLVMVPLASSIL